MSPVGVGESKGREVGYKGNIEFLGRVGQKSIKIETREKTIWTCGDME